MNIAGSRVLVTGASRGLGKALVSALRAAGCAKVYAAARNPASVAGDAVVTPIALDITSAPQIAAAAVRCEDVNILINNAGIAQVAPAIGAPGMDDARREMETNYFGTLAMCRAFAPVLARNGGGALVNVLSVASWMNVPMMGTYCASKAAAWSVTRAARFELRAQGTLVAGVYIGYMDTDMAVSVAGPKSSPADVAARIIRGIADNEEDILADERAEHLHAALLKDQRPFDAEMQAAWDARVRQAAE